MKQRGLPFFLHWALVLVYPVALYILVRTGFVQLALILIVLSKWRMFAVRPRFWLANIRANSVDIIVALAVLAFMTQTASPMWQLGWAAVYVAWLVGLKPRSGVWASSVQAGVGMVAGLVALYLSWTAGPLYGLVMASGLVCYLAARHFFDGFDERYARLLSYLWGYFGAALVWVLGHWLLFYGAGLIAQTAVLLVVIGGGLASLYYLDHFDKLNKTMARQVVFAMGAVVVILLAVSSWGSTIV